MITVVLAIAVVLVCVLLLGVKVLFVKGGKFPSGHAGAIPELRRRGIGCASGSHSSSASGKTE